MNKAIAVLGVVLFFGQISVAELTPAQRDEVSFATQLGNYSGLSAETIRALIDENAELSSQPADPRVQWAGNGDGRCEDFGKLNKCHSTWDRRHETCVCIGQ